MKTRKLEILFLTGFSSTKMFVNSKNLRQWKSGFHSSEKVDSLHIKLCISPWRNKIKSWHLHWNFWILQFLHDTYKFTCQLTIRVMSLFWVDNNMKISIFPVLDITRKTHYNRAHNNLEDLPQKLNGNAVEFISLLKKTFPHVFQDMFPSTQFNV